MRAYSKWPAGTNPKSTPGTPARGTTHPVVPQQRHVVEGRATIPVTSEATFTPAFAP
jgi:hypothetical protein